MNMTNNKLNSILVIGAGISGIEASLTLAEQGYRVILVDKYPSIGGKMAQLDKTFPTLDCSICILAPKMVETARHPNIELLPYSEVQELEGQAGNFQVKILKKAKYVDWDKCTGCGQCTAKCPMKKIPNEFEEGMGNRTAIYIPFPQAVPRKATIDAEHCLYLTKGACQLCLKECEAEAINFEMEDEVLEYDVGSIIVATGYGQINPNILPRYHYEEYPNVITAMQYERLLSASGPTEGEIIRPSDQQHAHNIAFIGCVGSRNEDVCSYCSKFCCMYMAKEGVVTREHASDTNVSIFFNDTRVIGKNQEEFIERAKDEYNLIYYHGIPGDVREDPETHDLLVKHANLDTGEVETTRFDLVVLANAVTPSEGTEELAKILGIETNKLGFFKTKDSTEDLESTKNGIYITGSCQSPDDIANSVSKAGGAAVLASLYVEPLSEDEQRVKLPPLKDVRVREQPRIGVFVCECGINIGGYMDIPEIVEYAKTLPDVVFSMHNKYSCSSLTQDIIKEKIDELNLNRVIVAACTPRTHEPLFQKTIREAGLNEYLFNFVSIRELDSWVHMEDRAKATDKAKDLIRMGVARTRFLKPEFKIEGDVVPEALVVGGGIAGMTSAMEIAKKGFNVHLIEKDDKLGGQLNLIYKLNFDRIDSGEFLEKKLQEYNSLKNVKTYLNSELTEVNGAIGDFIVKVKDTTSNKVKELNVGVIIVATGAHEYKPEGWYHYGEEGMEDKIMTQLELSDKLRNSQLKDGEDIVFVHCVGSRQTDPDMGVPYCSLICCSESIRHALYVKENYPNSNIYVLYRDIRVGTDEEQYYWEARENINYIRFNEYPEVTLDNGTINVEVSDILTQTQLSIDADRLVLSTPLVPYDNKLLSELLKVPIDQNGFFLEAHIKLRPVDFATAGIYLAGTAHGPKGIADSISQGRGAAAHAMIPLISGVVENEPLVSHVEPALCIACQKCEEVCNYGAIGVQFNGNKMISESNPLLCMGCGDCAAACPAGAITMSHFADNQLIPMISEAVKGEFVDERPRIVAFLCNWCSYAGADTCGVSRFQYPTNIRPIRVMCSGRIPKSYILQAFLEGADGVLIGGCHIGDCHYLKGNYDALRRYHELDDIIEKVGINPKRLHIEWVSASEGKRFADVVTTFVNQIKELGPLDEEQKKPQTATIQGGK
ncbi:MAG: CoB--CoM heterodisulfide reductase iron-sulfur subunit A [Promethearchaeota archaeon]|nr:MAG: CoB--CoM heterodisulfide reductase iron-sulfur subunit A [Candidatus Lokiarchaeota archaeon]